MEKRKLIEKKEIASQKEKTYYCQRLSKMIQCETVSSKETFCAKKFLALRDVIASLFPTVCEKAQIQYFGDDCYVYRIAGVDPSKNVMLMSHHDVVPATGEWRYPPFSGVVAEDCIWGRGTVDTKTPLFAEFSALEELLCEKWTPKYNVYIVSSHNEEIAGDGVPLVLQWLKESGTKFEWILDEGGAVIEPPMSGISCKCAMLAVHEKGRYTIRMRAKQMEGHSSLATQVKSPSVRMANFITRIEKEQPFLRKMHPEVKAMFEGLAPYMNFPMRFVFQNLWCFERLLTKVIPSMNASAGSMLGTTCSFRNLSSDTNGDCIVEVCFRCINEEDLQKDLATFYRMGEEEHVVFDGVIENEFHKPARLESNGYRYIKSIVEQQFDYAACAPFILPAGTDARHFSDLSDAVIRFAPIDINNQQYASVHNANENIATESVVRAVRFYRELLKNM